MDFEDIRKKHGLGAKDEKDEDKDKTTSTTTGGGLSYADIAKKHGISYDVDDKYLDSFISDINAFSKTDEAALYGTWNKLDLGTRANTVRGWLYHNKSSYDAETYKSLSDAVDNYVKLSDFYSKFANEDEYNKWYEKYEKEQDKKRKTEELLNSEDFAYYSQMGANFENPSMKDAEGAVSIFGWKPGATNIGNIVTYSRDNADMLRMGALNGSRLLGDFRYSHMTDDEVSIYNYYLAKYGEDKATEYLKSIDDELNRREAGIMAEATDGNLLLETVLGYGAGFENAIQGFKNLPSFIMGTDPDTSYSATQYADQIASQNNTGFTKIVHDLSSNLGNMTPSLMVGSLTGGLGGAITMGTSAMGNAYTDMKRLGYDDGAAQNYAFLVGASESTLSYLLGGISQLGGGGKGIFQTIAGKIIPHLDNAIARVAIQVGGNMLDEGLEEALQEVLDPIFKMAVTGEDFEGIDLENVLYSGLLGMLSGGLLEGVPTIAGTAIQSNLTKKHGQTIIENGGVDPLRELALEVAGVDQYAIEERTRDQNKLANLAGKVEKKASAKNVGKLSAQLETTITEQNRTEIESALVEKGLTKREAKIAAKDIVGGELTTSEKSMIESDHFQTAINAVLEDSDLNVSNGMAKLYEARLGKDATTPTDSPSVEGETPSVTKNPTVVENTAESKISASEGGANQAVAKATMLDNEGNEVEVTPKRIASIENGEMLIELEDGSTVNADEVDFGESGAGLIYQSAVDMASRVGGFGADTANTFIRGYSPALGVTEAEYTHGWIASYKFGAKNSPRSVLATNPTTSMLTAELRETAYNFGKEFGNEQVQKTPITSEKKGRVHFDGAKYGKTLNERQRASLKALNFLSKALGIDIYVMESKSENGKRIGENGWYDPTDRSIHIDLYAGAEAEALMLYTAAHEMTHHIREVLPEKFNVLADAIFEEYTKKYGEHVMEDLIKEKTDFLKEKGRITEAMTEEEAYDLAYEEVIADCCETMLTDSNAMEALSKNIYAKDKGLWNAIKRFFTDLINRIKAAYNNVTPDSEEGQRFRHLGEGAERIKNLWVEAIVAASEVSNLVEIDTDTKSVSPMFSERTWKKSEYVTEREETAKKISKALDVDINTAYKYIDDINGVARLIADDRARLDYEPNLDENASVLKPNSEYKYSVDMSTLCAKRLLFTGTFDAIQRALPNTVFDSEDIVALREMMQKRDYEVACGICYVESTRREIGRITQDFIDSYKKAQKSGKPITRINSEGKEVDLKKTKDQKETTADKTTDKFFAEKDYTPTLADLNTTDIDLVKRDHPLVYEAYLNFMNARGQAKPKLLETRAEYKGEILKHFKYTSAVNARNNAGGLRLQSFSDFEVPHMIDMMQIVMDMSRVGLKSQAYTKVPAFAEIFGDSGVKINLSLIAKGDGLDANGNLIFDDVEGINHKEAFKLRDKYSKNVGTILVGKTDAHIIAAMADPRIDYIIPFHKSSWKESLYDALGLTGYADYTDFQNEKPIDKDRKIKNFDPSEYWDFTKSGDENAQIYLEKCREDGRIPKFPQFQGYPGYWKLLIDFKMYDNDGVGSPQEVVKPIFNTEASERILREYEGGHKSFPVAKDVVEDFVKEHRTKHSDRASNPYDGKILYADSEVYNYSFMTSLDPMTVKSMPPLSTVKVDGRISQAKTVELGLKNAASIGVKVAEEQYAIKNAYTKRDIILGKGGLQHSLDASSIPRLRTNARLSAIGGYIVQNAVPINGLIKENKQANGTYAMACLLNDGEGFVVAIVTVDEFTSSATKFDFVEITHSINGRFLAKKEDSRSSTRELELGQKSLSTTAISEISIADFLEIVNSSHQSILSNDVLEHFGATRNPDGHYAKRVLFSDRPSSKASYAPTFYSQMGEVIDDIKLEKMGTSSILNHLKNRGVKNEEIKWSGIEAFLEGKKSVTKAELQEFLAGSQLQIEEEMSGLNQEAYDELEALWKQHAGVSLSETFSDDFDLPLTEDNLADVLDDMEKEGYDVPPLEIQRQMLDLAKKAGNEGRWSKYKLSGGKNYRELVFKMPNSSYSNDAMKAHWGEDAEGVLAHARIQDMTTADGKRMLFVEEIQSDWHNEGQKKGYDDDELFERQKALKRKAHEAFLALEDYSVAATGLAGEWETIERTPRGAKLLREYREIEAELKKASDDYIRAIPDAPFRTNYHEYVLKRLLRMAAEEGYDSIGWTPADIQSERWSEDYAEGYRIEYDQDIPKFLRKYGKKWGATVGKADVGIAEHNVNGEHYDAENIEVWSMDIPDSMKDSVLYEGQVFYSDRVTEKKVLNFLENQEHITVYRAMQVIDGELYPPMAAKIKSADGKNKLVTPSKIGAWEQAVERPDLIRNGNKFKLDKANGSSIDAAYNPYFHTSASPLNDQFSSAYKRPNLVIVEGVIPSSELTSGYRAEFAKDTVGETKWHSGPVASKLKGDKARRVFLSRWFKPVRIVPDSEVAAIVAKTLEGENIDVPYNVVTPSLRAELEKVGVPIKYQDRNTNGMKNRTLLANALETAAQNDIERDKLKQYKEKIELISTEEQKLHDIREQIKELSFKKGPRDTEAIKKLLFDANQAANRINTYDRQLLTLESTKALKGVLEREKAQARKRAEQKAEQRRKDDIAKVKERAAKTQRELMDRYKESRKKGVESRKKTEMRHKIKDVVNELNQYLTKGTKEKHVPIELQKAVAEALDAVNMDTVGAEERIAKLQEELRTAKTLEDMQAITKKIERIKEMGGNMEAKLSRLKTAYDSIINSDDPLVANSHDDVISSSIDKVIEVVGNTPLRDMSLYQLEAVYDLYKMVLTSVRNANKAFKAAKGEEISTIANGVIAELMNKKRKAPYSAKGMQTMSEFDWNNLKPVYAFERIGSANFTKVFKAVRAGEDVWANDMSEAQAFREEQFKKYKYDSWDFNKRYGFTSTSGMNFELSLNQILSLYAFSKRDQAGDHLKYGGFVFDGLTEIKEKKGKAITVTYQLKDATAYNLSEETLAEIIDKLTPEQRAFADAMQDYLSTVMGEKGNEVSLALYGIKLFKEKHYFPLKSAPQYMAKAKEQAQGEVKIKNKGFTKETTPKAKNPIVLSSFMDVWAGHVNEMSMYHAFTLPLEDFYRVYNYHTPANEKMEMVSVGASLENAHGQAAVKYIDQLLKDLNGGARSDSTVGFINKMIGAFKKSAVFASASVVIQQPSAIARATALVDTKYFVGKPSKGKHSDKWAEVKKYAPVAVIKEMGYFDTGMGKGSVEWLKGDKTFMDKVDDVVSKAPALADELAWVAIWDAVKRETVHNRKDLRPGSEEFLKAVGERFTEVVTKTQVYDSTLSRSANMRSKDTGMKMATAFMAEPTTSLNMLENALIQGKRGDKRYARKAIGSVVASMILNSILVSFVYAGRDDDEDKTYVEKYIGTLTEELLDSLNPLTLIPFVKDIVSIVQGYDVERSDMAVITDIINAWNNLDSDNRSVYRKVEDFAGAIAAIFGLPVKNIMRDARAMYNTVNSFINGEKTTGAGIKNAIGEAVTGKEKSNGQQLYEAIVSGDAVQIERVKSGFKDQKAIDSAIRKALRENDPRIKEAAEARYKGNIPEYMKIAKAIIADGFKQDDVVAAINSEINDLKPDAPSSSAPSDKVVSLYSIGDYYSALMSGASSMAYAVREDLIETDIANGKDRDGAEADFNSRFANYLRDQYEEGNIFDYEAQNMLVNYGGKSEEDASSKVQYWNFKKQYPDYDLTEEAVAKYYSDVQPSGISIDVYYDYSKQRSKAKGQDLNGDGKTDSGSVKREVMQMINSLPISSYQKDALYFLNGWSQSTLYEAPWH